MLHFGRKPPFSFGEFLRLCQGLIPAQHLEILKNASLSGDYAYRGSATLEKWQEFDTKLRNELVKIRASRKKLDPQQYLRRMKDGYVEPDIAHLAMSAHKNPSLLEAEKTLDLERWRRLEALAEGHYFDLDFLIVYAHKLLLLERWERINQADKPRLVEEALKKDKHVFKENRQDH